MNIKELTRRLLEEHKKRCEFCKGLKEGKCPFFISFKDINWGDYKEVVVFPIKSNK